MVCTQVLFGVQIKDLLQNNPQMSHGQKPLKGSLRILGALKRRLGFTDGALKKHHLPNKTRVLQDGSAAGAAQAADTDWEEFVALCGFWAAGFGI